MLIILYEILSVMILLSASMVFLTKNPLNSVLYLIILFINTSIMFLLIEVDYLARRLRRVYVGAIMVLFIFVLILVNLTDVYLYIQTEENKYFKYLRRLRLFSRFYRRKYYYTTPIYTIQYLEWYKLLDDLSGIKLIGQIIYKYYIERLYLSGRFLTLARFGSVVLTIKLNKDILFKKQELDKQRSRNSKHAILLIKNKW